MPGEVDMMPALTVVEMNEKRLTIDIKPPKGKKFRLPEKTTEEEEEEEKIEDCDLPSSAEIEVVHRHPLPDLHSILKQRTTSESSEEISNGDPDSPRSESEELSSSFNKKRSVSFSSYVDHASFKSSASVSSMTPALKSKRRRQRKREEKKKGRVRCNSEGTSSSEECLNSVSDSYSQSEEEGDSTSCRPRGGGRKAHLYRAMSDPGPNAGGLSTIAEGEKGRGQVGKKIKKKNKDSVYHTVKQDCLEHLDDKPGATAKIEDGDKIGDSVKEKLADVEMKVDLVEEDDKVTKLSETKETLSGEEKLDKNKKLVSEIREKLKGDSAGKDNEDIDDSDDDGFVDAVSSLNEEFKDKMNCHDTAHLIEVMEPSPDTDRSETIDNSSKASDKSKKSDVETILSWEDGDVNKENVKECAVHFANSIMFDLDVE